MGVQRVKHRVGANTVQQQYGLVHGSIFPLDLCVSILLLPKARAIGFVVETDRVLNGNPIDQLRDEGRGGGRGRGRRRRVSDEGVVGASSGRRRGNGNTIMNITMRTVDRKKNEENRKDCKEDRRKSGHS